MAVCIFWYLLNKPIKNIGYIINKCYYCHVSFLYTFLRNDNFYFYCNIYRDIHSSTNENNNKNKCKNYEVLNKHNNNTKVRNIIGVVIIFLSSSINNDKTL